MIRYILISLSLCLLLPAGVALAQTPNSDYADLIDQAQTIVIGSGSFLGVFTEDSDCGVTVTRVVKDSPADKAGIKKDDIISSFNNEEVSSVNKMNRLINEAAPGQTISLVVTRDGGKQNISLKLGKRTDYPQVFTTRVDSDVMRERLQEMQERAQERSNEARERSSEARERAQERAGEARQRMDEMRAQGKLFSNDGQVFSFGFSSSRRIGVTTTDLSEQLADFFGVKDKHGVLVQTVSENSPAAKAGIKAGDVIIDVDGEKVEQVNDISRAIGRKEEGDVKVTLVRNKSQMTVNVTPEKRPASESNFNYYFGTPDAFSFFPEMTMPNIQFEPMIQIEPMVMPRITIPSVNIPRIRFSPMTFKPRLVFPRRVVNVPMSPVVSY